MVVISVIQENKGSPETSGVDVVKGQTELESSSDDENYIEGNNELVVINLMGSEDHNINEDGDYESDGDDSENEGEETFDEGEASDDNDVNEVSVDESEELSDDGSDRDEEVGEEFSLEESNNGSDSSEQEGEIEHIQDGKVNSPMDIVNNVMQKTARKTEKNESIVVSKHLDLEYDLGKLLATDPNELNLNSLRNSTEDYLKNLARENTQLLINHIWKLPITRKESQIVAKLPKPSTKIPREKPIPEPKPLTKWEQFAREKGIKKQPRTKKQWDETLKKWIPRWGYQRAQALKEKKWIIESKKNDDPMVDPFTKSANEKKERVAKNELQRLKNLARASKIKIPRDDKMKRGGTELEKGTSRKPLLPRMGLLTSDKLDSTQLKQALTISKYSTASLGIFQDKLKDEIEAKKVSQLMPMVKKRRAPMANAKEERKVNLEILDLVLKKKPKLDVEKAVNLHMNVEQRRRAQEKSQMSKNQVKKSARGRGKNNKSKKGGNKNVLKGRGKGKMGTGNKSITGKPKRKGGKKR